MRTKNNPEMPMVPKAHLKNVEHQRDQYKAENEELKHQWDYLYKSLASLQEDYNDLEQQYDELFRRYEMLNELI